MERVFLATAHEEETHTLGHRLGQLMMAGCVLALRGDLGMGKSVLARGILRGLGVKDPYLTSPTFTILNYYEDGRLPASHFDFYRLAEPEELLALGVRDYLPGDGVAMVEWPEKAMEFLPADRLDIFLTDGCQGPESRTVTITASGPLSRGLMHDYRQRFPE
ncbi:MAG: tRNA (adenosine(37)-N6)-threonylcarbamoyltransferase complex ATPase subunit type 1 TsaE [Magnetococcales bacterium]|nr:tRNA (adenosine(37)-N6)-threonylcarbamoyltransferase complex ATPase subunit type 1 TsaE [Magnetococcales bacterium]NGZ28902.1 tRNA (adenosine(37)-N6)-threonylcarbamoyltransferase complex ATPase subunit type 1 TsaE [Magnetococcales bacterium]